MLYKLEIDDASRRSVAQWHWIVVKNKAEVKGDQYVSKFDKNLKKNMQKWSIDKCRRRRQFE